jgi:hypothetical protein
VTRMSGPVPEVSQPPCVAFQIVAACLPDAYWARPPILDTSAVLVTYIARADGVPARFVMPNALANWVLHRLETDPSLEGGRLARIQVENYRGVPQ